MKPRPGDPPSLHIELVALRVEQRDEVRILVVRHTELRRPQPERKDSFHLRVDAPLAFLLRDLPAPARVQVEVQAILGGVRRVYPPELEPRPLPPGVDDRARVV